MEISTVLVFLFSLLTLLFNLSLSETIVVDGVSEWKNPTVKVGDSVIFRHKDQYNVYIFRNRRAFDLCNFTEATLLTKSSTTYTWNPSRLGFFFFAFNNGSTKACEDGQKIAIEVSSESSASSPTAAPGKGGSMSPSGSMTPGGTGGSMSPSGSMTPGGKGGSTSPSGSLTPGGKGGSMSPSGSITPGGKGGTMSPYGSMTPGKSGGMSPSGSMTPGKGGSMSPSGSMTPGGKGGSMSPSGSMSPGEGGSMSPSGLMMPGKGGSMSPFMSPGKGGTTPFINSNPAVPLPTGEVDSATIGPASPTSSSAHKLQVVGFLAVERALCCVVFLMMLL